jgi:hypothetical protein
MKESLLNEVKEAYLKFLYTAENENVWLHQILTKN